MLAMLAYLVFLFFSFSFFLVMYQAIRNSFITIHPAGRTISSDWSVNSSIMVVHENIF